MTILIANQELDQARRTRELKPRWTKQQSLKLMGRGVESQLWPVARRASRRRAAVFGVERPVQGPGRRKRTEPVLRQPTLWPQLTGHHTLSGDPVCC